MLFILKVRGTAKELPSAKTSCATSTTTSTPGVQTGCDGIEVNERSRRVDGGGRNEGSGLLLEGEYDEQASAQSFQEALAEWRAGSKGQLQDPTKTPGFCSISDYNRYRQHTTSILWSFHL